ncbi:MAG: tyrosine-protein phosphatase [Bacteroidetes bacterium]|nr:tyrosine-protein phosphatase [Bacteroidota bacterium]
MKQLNIINRLNKVWESNEGIDIALLYGSFGRNEVNPNSDIDTQVIVNGNFNVIKLIDTLKEEFSNEILSIVNVRMRNKVVVYFNEIPKLEIGYSKAIEDINRNYLGSEINNISETILYQRVPSLYDIGSYLAQLVRDSGNNRIGSHSKHLIEDLVQKFIYEFESCSSNHKRSDGYKFYFFYNIALHCVVQLRHLLHNDTRFNFLPKYFIPGMENKEEMKSFYQLTGSIFLPDANKKKRLLLDYFYEVLIKLEYGEINQVKKSLEAIFERDYFWNLRDIATFNPRVKKNFVYRTATLSAFQNDDKFEDLMNTLKIKTIVDLRADQELIEMPYNESVLSKVNYIHAPLDPWNQPEWFKKDYQYGNNEEIAYRYFGMGCKDSYLKAFKALINEDEGSVAIHCFAGKDRTGIFISMLHMLNGADENVIYNDYLASEVDVKKERLDIVLNIIKESGGIIPFMKSCGLSEQEVTKLRNKLFLN